jgi:hypothetical protein
MFEWIFYGVAIAGAIGFLVLRPKILEALRLRRAEFIRTYKLPRGMLNKLSQRRPNLTRKECALVSRGLRQFFVAYLMSGGKFVSMPSQIVDELWHEFILYTRDYDQFCMRAFGDFMHHTPAVALSEDAQTNEGLRRVWWYTCKYENVDPYNPTRVPLLFALDAKLKIENGFVYHPQCDELRKQGNSNVHCGGDFSASTADGGTAGFGESSSDSSSSDGGSSGDSGGGCGGGCGS